MRKIFAPMPTHRSMKSVVSTKPAAISYHAGAGGKSAPQMSSASDWTSDGVTRCSRRAFHSSAVVVPSGFRRERS